MPATSYTLEELDDLEEQTIRAGPDNFKSACKYIIDVCQRAGVEMAVFGGFSLGLRGSQRWTVDIDVYVKCTMNTIKTVLQDEERVIRPGFTMADVYRVFIMTGGEWDGTEQQEQVVEIDLMPTGNLIRSEVGIEMIQAYGFDIPVFDVPTMVRNKLKAFDQREAAKDLHDIQWLLDHYPDRASVAADDTDLFNCQGFIDALEDNGLQDELIAKYRELLNVG